MFCSVKSLNTKNLDWLTGQASVPVIGCIGESSEGRLGHVQLDEGAHVLSAYTKPLKVLLLNAAGGITDHTGQVHTLSISNKHRQSVA